MYSAYNLPHFRLVALSFGERSYDPSPNDRVKYFPHKHFTHTNIKGKRTYSRYAKLSLNCIPLMLKHHNLQAYLVHLDMIIQLKMHNQLQPRLVLLQA